MKIDRKKLLGALAIAGKVVKKSDGMPILSCVLIGGGTLKATDLDVAVEVPLETEGSEIVCISHSDLNKIVKSMETDVETVTITPKAKAEGEDSDPGHMVTIQDYWDLATQDASEFPEINIPKTSKDNWATVEAAALKNTLVACGKPDEGFKLNVAQFDAEEQKIVATDGHRLHMGAANVKGMSWGVNAHFARIILGCLGKEEDEVTFKCHVIRIIEEGNGPDFTGKKKADLEDMAKEMKVEVPEKATVAQIKTAIEAAGAEQGRTVVKNAVVDLEDGTKFVITVAEQKFPDYKAFVPKEAKHTITIRPKDVEKPLQQAMAIMNDRYRSLKLTFNGGIDVEINNPDKGTYMRETIPVTGKVDPALVMGLDPSLLKDVLNTAQEDTEVTVELNAGNKPLVFKHSDFYGLVMPMKV